jgi:regulator of sigma D
MSSRDAHTERRSQTPHLVSAMLQERQLLLSLLVQLSGPATGRRDAAYKSLLEDFSQVLVDYVAAGHFGLYDRIIRGTERRRAVSELALTIYPQVQETTEAALAFNDKYGDGVVRNAAELTQDLSRLGEVLTSRIELEDRLIDQLLLRDQRPPPERNQPR